MDRLQNKGIDQPLLTLTNYIPSATRSNTFRLRMPTSHQISIVPVYDSRLTFKEVNSTSKFKWSVPRPVNRGLSKRLLVDLYNIDKTEGFKIFS